MRLTQYLHRELVLSDLAGTDMESVVGALAIHLAGHLDGVDREEVESALLAREKVHTTTLGRGVAVPHATLPRLETPVLIVARTEDAVQFGPAGTEPARYFFVLLSPPGREREHIKLLARICRLVRVTGFMESLERAENAQEIVAVIERMDEEHV